MLAVEFWADGFPGHTPSEVCPSCHGNMWPMRQPDPDPKCTRCFGMGGGLAIMNGRPFVIMPTLTFYQTMTNLLGFVQNDFNSIGRMKANDLAARLAMGENNVSFLPDVHLAAEIVIKLRDLAQFANEVDADIVWA